MNPTEIERLHEEIKRNIREAFRCKSIADEASMHGYAETAVLMFMELRKGGCSAADARIDWLRTELGALDYDENDIERNLIWPNSNRGTPASRWKKKGKVKTFDPVGTSAGGAEHTSNQTPTNIQPHEESKAAKRQSRGGEKGDSNRDYPRRKPDGHRGPWPPLTVAPLQAPEGGATEGEGPTMSEHELYQAALTLAQEAQRTGKPYPLAELKLAAQAGSPDAIYALGTWYLYGRAVEKNLKEAVALFQQAAEMGCAAAQYDLAVCYESGEAVESDLTLAFRYYLASASNGDLKGQTETARCLFYGVGTDQDRVEAARWYLKAAERGDAESQYFIGRAYELGEGVNVDLAEAIRWYKSAESNGQEAAKEALKDLDADLN